MSTTWIRRAVIGLLVGRPYQSAILESSRSVVRLFEEGSYSYRNDSFAYVSKFSWFGRECESCDAIVHFFPGGFYSGTQYDLAPLMQYISLAYDVQPWSVNYRLASEGTSYDELVSDARAAIGFLRKRMGPGRKIVALGSSAGARLAMRVSDLVDGVILDSAGYYCATTQKEDGTPIDSKDADYQGLSKELFDVIRSASSYECYPTPVAPTFVAHGKEDIVTPLIGAQKYVQRHPGVAHCFADGGSHIAPFSDACNEEVKAWIDARFGWDAAPVAQRALAQTMSQAFGALARVNNLMERYLPAWMLDVFVRECRNVSPVEADSKGCTGLMS